MAMPWTPEFEGRFPREGSLSAPASAVFNRLAENIAQKKLLTGRPDRNAYRITTHTDYRLAFEAEDWKTILAVGLNEVTLDSDTEGGIRYGVRFYSWRRYCTLMMLPTPILLAVLFPSLYFTQPDFRTQTGGYLWVILGLLLFFSFLWPHVLCMFQKPLARSVLQRWLSMAESEAVSGSPTLPEPRYEYESPTRIAGLPLLHICLSHKQGGIIKRAHGIIAIGDVAVGVVAIGGIAVGGIAIGGVTVGIVALGGVAIGAVAIGGVALGGLVIGGLAIGGKAIGGLAINAVSHRNAVP